MASAGSNEEASILRSYLEHHDIYVYVQGENHRSMLGMVGAYIDLNIMVPRESAGEAERLLEEFHAAAHETEDGAEHRGPYRDEGEEDDDEDSGVDEVEIRRKVRGARMVALFLPFGTGHLAAGATLSGFVLVLISLAGMVLGVGRNPALGLLWPMAVAMDFILVPRVVRRMAQKRRKNEN